MSRNFFVHFHNNQTLILGCTNNKPRIIIRGLRYSFYRQRFRLCCDLSNDEPVNQWRRSCLLIGGDESIYWGGHFLYRPPQPKYWGGRVPPFSHDRSIPMLPVANILLIEWGGAGEFNS